MNHPVDEILNRWRETAFGREQTQSAIDALGQFGVFVGDLVANIMSAAYKAGRMGLEVQEFQDGDGI